MQYRFSFKHMSSSQALQDYSRSKIEVEIAKFSTKPIEVQVVFGVDKHKHHVVCTVFGGDGFSFTVEHVCDDMYGSVDHMIDKLSTQLKKRKDKLKDHKFPKSREPFASIPADNDGEVDADEILKFENARRRKYG